MLRGQTPDAAIFNQARERLFQVLYRSGASAWLSAFLPVDVASAVAHCTESGLEFGDTFRIVDDILILYDIVNSD